MDEDVTCACATPVVAASVRAMVLADIMALRPKEAKVLFILVDPYLVRENLSGVCASYMTGL